MFQVYKNDTTVNYFNIDPHLIKKNRLVIHFKTPYLKYKNSITYMGYRFYPKKITDKYRYSFRTTKNGYAVLFGYLNGQLTMQPATGINNYAFTIKYFEVEGS